MHDDRIRWGIAGTGFMAGQFANDLALVPGAVLAAVASRDAARASAFAARFGKVRALAGYAALAAAEDVDIVYVATEHQEHPVVAMQALVAGKHVLVEKPMACTVAAARAVVALARQQVRFCMEAQWTRFLPAVRQAQRLIGEGALGEVRGCHLQLGAPHPVDGRSRLFDPARGGGALLELGVHTLALANFLLGPFERTHGVVERVSTGVDGSAAVGARHHGGASSLHAVSLVAPTANEAVVVGSRAQLALRALTVRQGFTLTVGSRPQEAEFVPAAAQGLGYVHEIEEVMRCLGAGMLESPSMPLADSLAVLEVVDRLLAGG
jgi:predicted dehydrogenase